MTSPQQPTAAPTYVLAPVLRHSLDRLNPDRTRCSNTAMSRFSDKPINGGSGVVHLEVMECPLIGAVFSRGLSPRPSSLR